MKKTLYSITTILVITLAFGLSSCLKDSRYVDFTNVGTLIELPLSAYDGIGNPAPEALPIKSTPQSFPLVVNVASPKPLSTAVTVTFKLNTDSLAKYNAKYVRDSTAYANDTTGTVPAPPEAGQYILPPANAYSIPSLSCTIPANQRMASISISVITANLVPGVLYAIPLTIVNASGQKISNYNTVFFAPQPKNSYDGNYSVKGHIERNNGGVQDPNLGGTIKSGVFYPVATTGANSDSFNQTWADGSIAGGINPLILTVNPATNAVTVVSTINATLENLPGYNCRYDPVKKIFYIGIIWNGLDPTNRSAIDTLTYSGSR